MSKRKLNELSLKVTDMWNRANEIDHTDTEALRNILIDIVSNQDSIIALLLEDEDSYESASGYTDRDGRAR